MYSKDAWGGSEDSFILVKFDKEEQKEQVSDPLVSLVIFEWRDEELIGRYAEGDKQRVRGPFRHKNVHLLYLSAFMLTTPIDAKRNDM